MINNFENLLTKRNEKIINENCINCRCNKNKKISNYLLSASEIIIFNINKDDDPNNYVQLNYPNQFSNEDIINKNKNFRENRKLIYELFCVFRRRKNYNNSINFIMHCKNPINNNWYTYDNNLITQETTIPFTSQDVYLLVYQTK